MKLFAALALAGASSFATADLVTYRYSGTVATNTHWSAFHGDPIEVSVTIDTGTAATSQFGNQAIYQNAVVDGYFQIGATRFNMADNPSVNNVNVRTGVVDPNFGTTSNRYQITFSSDGVARDGWEFPSNISLWVIDKDINPDTVLDTGLLQPLDTVATQQNGGVDSIVASMGAARGSVFSTITSGDGSVLIVPAPAGALALAGGLLATRRRR